MFFGNGGIPGRRFRFERHGWSAIFRKLLAERVKRDDPVGQALVEI